MQTREDLTLHSTEMRRNLMEIIFALHLKLLDKLRMMTISMRTATTVEIPL